MAVVIPAVVAAVAASAPAFIAGTLTAGTFLTSLAVNLVLTGLSTVFTDEPDFGSSGGIASAKSGGLTQQARQPITPHRVVYGQVRVSGPLTFAATSENNKYLHVIVTLAAHEIEAIDEVWIDDVPIAVDGVDGNGLVNDGGFYNGLVRIKKYLGTDSQTADSDLVSEVDEWTTAHRGRGRAYLYIRYQFNRDKFSSIPSASAYIRGKKVYDTRDTNTKFMPNPALITRDYLVSSDYGFGESTDNIDDDFTDSAANECEEFVDTASIDVEVDSIDTSADVITLDSDKTVLPFQLGDRVELITTDTPPGGLATSTNYYLIPYQFKDTARIQLATTYANALAYTAIDITNTGVGTHTIRKNGEPRYSAGGVIETDRTIETNIRDIVSAMGGQAIYANGKWRIKAAAYESPTVTIDEDTLIAPIKVSTKVGRAERFNRITGTYISPINYGEASDYPPIENSTYQTQDGETITKTYDLAFTQRPHTAQRLAKIELEKSRQEITTTLLCNLSAMQLQAGDTFYIDNTRLGWSSKIFEVLEWKFAISNDEEPQLGVQMLARETASSIYDWNSGEETVADPAPNTTLPDPFTVTIPIGVSLDSIPVLSLEGDKTYKIKVSWDEHSDTFVLEGGGFDIQYKLATDSEYKNFVVDEGTRTEAEIFQAELDLLYDIRIRAKNSLSVTSAWVTFEDFKVGSSVATDTEDWENATEARDPDDWENDSGLANEDWES